MPNKFNRVLARGVGVTPAAMGAAVPAATEVTVIGLVLCNTSASAISVSASLYDGVNDTYMVRNVTIPAGSSLGVIGGDQKVVLLPGDTIRLSSNTAASLDAIQSRLEIT